MLHGTMLAINSMAKTICQSKAGQKINDQTQQKNATIFVTMILVDLKRCCALLEYDIKHQAKYQFRALNILETSFEKRIF